MKRMKKVALLLVSVMLVSVLGGCGSFDAAGYMKAVMDNSYKNDSKDFVKMKVGTKEEAEKIYEQGIDAEMTAMTAESGELTDDLTDEFRQIIKDMLKSVKYTVGEAEKQDDDSYVVTIKYKKANIYAPAIELFTAQTEAYVAEMTEKAANGEEVPSEDEMNEQVMTMLTDALKESLKDVTYGEEETTTVKIELIDKVYTPNESDITKLEGLMLDIDSVEQ